MSWQKIKALKEERGQALADMKAILNKSETEKRDLTPEETVKFETLNTDAEKRKLDIERYETTQNLELELNKGKAKTEQRIGREDIQNPEQQLEANKAEQRQQMDRYLRTGTLENIETRALTISGAGGVVGDRPMYDQLVNVLKQYAGCRQAGATVLGTSTGNPFTVPTSNDTTSIGVITAEGVTQNTELDPTIGSVAINAYKFDSLWIVVSQELIQDNAFGLESFILNAAGERIGRALNQYSTNGTGTGQPTGVITGGTLGYTAASTSTFTYQELVNTYHSIDPAYRMSKSFGWMMHDSTLAAIRLLQDGNGRYIFTAGESGTPDKILNAPYTVNVNMPQLTSGAGSKVLAVADFSRVFMRDVTAITLVRATELFAASGSIGYRVWSRHDSQITDSSAIKYMALAAA